MALQGRKEAPGVYQLGIYHVQRVGREWLAHATGRGTIGDGYVGSFPTLNAAHLQLTGENIRD